MSDYLISKMVPPLQGGERDWSHLPPDLVLVIAKKLPAISDRIHFRAVCSAWRDIDMDVPLFLLNFPCYFLHSFVLPYCVVGRHRRILPDIDSLPRYLLNPSTTHSDTSSHTPSFPNTSSFIRIFGSAFGYLLIVDYLESTISLFNLFTLSHIQLPPVINEQGEAIRFGEYCRGKLVKSESGLSIIIFFLRYDETSCDEIPFFILYCPGDSAWRVVYPDFYCNSYEIRDITYHDGKFFIKFFNTVVIDPNHPTDRKEIPAVHRSHRSRDYLVESSSGDLLMVVIHMKKGRIKRVELFQLVNSEQPRWIKITSIGDDVLFVNSSNAICFAAGGFDKCRANCMYFWNWTTVGLFDIAEGKVVKLPDSWGNFPQQKKSLGVWILPGL